MIAGITRGASELRCATPSVPRSPAATLRASPTPAPNAPARNALGQSEAASAGDGLLVLGVGVALALGGARRSHARDVCNAQPRVWDVDQSERGYR
jgi:hypothetical protein